MEKRFNIKFLIPCGKLNRNFIYTKESKSFNDLPKELQYTTEKGEVVIINVDGDCIVNQITESYYEITLLNCILDDTNFELLKGELKCQF